MNGPGGPASSDGSCRSRRRGGRTRCQDVVVPALIRVAECAAQLLIVLVLARRQHLPFADRFTLWDAQLYAQIAEHGYPDRVVPTAGGLAVGGNLAFSPLFPALERMTSDLSGLAPVDAGVLLAWLAGVTFSVGVHRMVMQLGHSRRAGYLACTLIGALPMSVVLQMAYPESLLAALMVWALIAAEAQRWWVAGGLAFAAGLTRPTGYVLMAGLLVVVWVHARTREGRLGVPRPAVVACLLSGLGTVAFWGYVAAATGRLDGWFFVERAGWGTHVDLGRSFAEFEWSTLSDPSSWTTPSLIVSVVMLVWAAVSVGAVVDKSMRPIGAVALLTLVSVIVSTNYWHSRPRIMLAAAIIVVPLGCWVAHSPRLRWTLPGTVTALAMSWWFGAYMITIWPYAI